MDGFTPTNCADRFFTTDPFHHDTDLLFGSITLARRLPRLAEQRGITVEELRGRDIVDGYVEVEEVEEITEVESAETAEAVEAVEVAEEEAEEEVAVEFIEAEEEPQASES